MAKSKEPAIKGVNGIYTERILVYPSLQERFMDIYNNYRNNTHRYISLSSEPARYYI